MRIHPLLLNAKLAVPKLAYPRWSRRDAALEPGYSVLLLVPGDLPVFIKTGLDVLSRQRLEHLREILILPDRLPRDFGAYFEQVRSRHPDLPLRVVPASPGERYSTALFNRPAWIPALQFMRGLDACTTQHAIWHDADAFIWDAEFLECQYRVCRDENLACVGVNEAWDPSLEERGLGHLVATWELMVDLDWARRFPPWKHFGHFARYDERWQSFDISFLPQALTDAARIGRRDMGTGFVHFGYVIGGYRLFQATRGTFEDKAYSLLLIRLFVDAYEESDWPYPVPSIEQLARGIQDDQGRVSYRSERARRGYRQIRAGLQKLLESGLLDRAPATRLEQSVAPWDRAFL